MLRVSGTGVGTAVGVGAAVGSIVSAGGSLRRRDSDAASVGAGRGRRPACVDGAPLLCISSWIFFSSVATRRATSSLNWLSVMAEVGGDVGSGVRRGTGE